MKKEKEVKLNREEISMIMRMYGTGTYIESIAKYIGKGITVKQVNEVIDTYHSAFFE